MKSNRSKSQPSNSPSTRNSNRNSGKNQLGYHGLEERNLLSGNLPAFDAQIELARNFIESTPETQYLVQGQNALQAIDARLLGETTTALFQQTHQGLPVFGTYVTVDLSGDAIQGFKGSGHASLTLANTQPQIQRAFAESLVADSFADQLFTTSSQLVVTAEGTLVWQVDTYLGDTTILNDITASFATLVDAISGDMIDQIQPTGNHQLMYDPGTKLGEFERIVINDTIGAAGSQTYGAQSHFNGVVALPGCTGVLVAPDIVLSARHCGSSAGNSIRFGPDSSNPVFTATAASVNVPAGAGSLLDGGDFLIITLTADVPASVATPFRLSPLTAGLEGQVAATVGFGLNGVGSTGHEGTADGLRWGGENIIEAYGVPAGQAGTNIISTDFDDGSAGANTIPTSSPIPLEFEATTAPGDSGGPILVQFGSEWVVSGVLSGGTSSTSVYGDISWWTGVQPYRALIESVGGVFAEGTVGLDKDVYFPNETVTITLEDFASSDPTVQATIMSTSGDSELVTLTKTSSSYVGTIDMSANPVTIADGNLQVSVADTITVSVGGSTDTAIIEEEVIVITGTDGNDVITVDIGQTVVVNVNGEDFFINPSQKASLEFNAKRGFDTITIFGGLGNEQTVVGEYFVQINGFFDFAASSVEKVTVNSRGGFDTAKMYGTDRDDVVQVTENSVSYRGQQFENILNGFDRVLAFAAPGGFDRVSFVDTAGNDRLYATPIYTNLTTSETFVNARGFSKVSAFATAGGFDAATFVGSAGVDTLYASSALANLKGAGFEINASGFERTSTDGAGGIDVANLVGTSGNDVYFSKPKFGYLYGAGYFNHVIRFENVTAHGSGGSDRANLYDSPGTDTFYGTPTYAAIYNDQYRTQANNFSRVSAFGSAGHNVATLVDSAGKDRFIGRPDDAYMVGAGFLNYLGGFDSVQATSSGGSDIAVLYGSREDNRFFGSRAFSQLTGSTFSNYAKNFRNVTAFLDRGFDRGRFVDSSGNDTFIGNGNQAILYSDDYIVHTTGLEFVTAVKEDSGTDVLSKRDLAFELIEIGAWNN